MRLHPMRLHQRDHQQLKSLVTSEYTRAFSDPETLRSLHQEIQRAIVVPQEELCDLIVGMNSTITLRDLKSQELETYTLVFPSQADIANRRLSVLSPAGVRMLGCQHGDNIGWLTHSGWRMMKIEKVVSPVSQKTDRRAHSEQILDEKRLLLTSVDHVEVEPRDFYKITN